VDTGFLRHVHACNTWNPAHFYTFHIDGERVGRIKRPIWEVLQQWPEWFDVAEDRVTLSAQIQGFTQRSEVLAQVTGQLLEAGMISHRHGESYPVTAGRRDQAYARIDRAAAPYFGLRAYGQHLNGYVRDASGLKLWVARRAADRRNYPSKLDNLVAGGLPQELGLAENLRKECWEEASIPAALACKAVPVGALTYCRETSTGLKPDTLYCYDLELPRDFIPVNSDGEVAEFYLMPVAEVAEIVRGTDDFKLNCNLVVIDFLMRQGIMTPEHLEYLELAAGLHERI
jgi:8-oxo-dGTP pyrophosphatase MutT (NUDIX family)